LRNDNKSLSVTDFYFIANVIYRVVIAIFSIKPTFFGTIKNILMKEIINNINSFNCNLGQYDLTN